MAAPTPYLGSKICLISKAEIRYEGILYTIDSKESTVALAKVRAFGTEDRKTDTPFPPRDEIFEYIIFKAADIKDLRVCQPPVSSLASDPAIVSHSMGPPPPPSGPGGPSFGDFSGTPFAGQGPPMFMPQSPFGGGLGLAPGAMMGGPGGPLPAAEPPIGYPPKVESCSQSLAEGSRASSPDQAKLHSQDRRHDDGDDDRNQRHGGQSSNYRGGEGSGQHHHPRNQRDNHHYQSRDGHHQQHHPQQQQQQQRDGYQQRRGPPQGAYGGRGNGGGGAGGSYPLRGRGGNMGRGRGGPGGPRGPPRGQLQPKEDPLKFDEEFDFEQANLEFQELESKMAKAKIADGDEEPDAHDTWSDDENQPQPPQPQQQQQPQQDDSAKSDKASQGEDAAEYYNKSKSFFDKISCEALERQKGPNNNRVDWRHERTINKETFGVSTHSWGYRRGGGGWGGGYNSYRGRGGYGSYRGRGGGGGGGGGYNRNYDHRRNYGHNQGYGGGYGHRSGGYDNRNRNNIDANNHNRGGQRLPQAAEPLFSA